MKKTVWNGARKKPRTPGIFRGMIVTAMLAAAALLFAYETGPQISLIRTASSSARQLVGRATVSDGDTVEIGNERIRINGIDAPESRQGCKDAHGQAWRCGTAAAKALDDFLAASRPLRCEYVERDRYGRFVGNCFRADGRSVAAWLVRNGHALDWPRYSNGAYTVEQAKARAGKVGIWSGEFEMPWDWRANRRKKKAATG